MAELPSFYDPGRVGTLYYPDSAALAAHAAQAQLPPAGEDDPKIHLLVVDMQVDFCHRQGSLSVPGALDDVRRLIEFIYRNAEGISDITCSLDSHLPYQIFHPAWWKDSQGHHPPPFTVITYQEVQEGRWVAQFEEEWSVYYVRRLQQEAKKQLTIWPYHVPIGGIGNALDPELWSAIFWHSVARRSQPRWWRKGDLAQTEHYSIVRPEVPVPESSPPQESQDLWRELSGKDYLIVAGEAASHCVLETVKDLIEEFVDRPEVLRKIFLLRDCTSPVQHPEIDFEAVTREAFARFQEQGIRLIVSTDPLPL